MLRPRSEHLDGHSLEQRPAVVAALPRVGDRVLIRTALAVGAGLGARVHAVAFSDPRAALPAPLRFALAGPGVRTEADRAIRHLVDEAIVGAHVAVRPLPTEPEAADAAVRRLGEATVGGVVVVGHVRGEPPPPAEAMARLLAAFRGPAVVVLETPLVAFEEVAAVTPPHGSGAESDFRRLAWGLERSYPVWFRHEITTPDALDVIARDCTEETLLLVSATSGKKLGPIDHWSGRLQTLSDGPIAVVLPEGPKRAALVVRLLGLD